MMLYFTTQGLSRVSLFDIEADSRDRKCATVVLGHSGGAVGFDRASGEDAIKAIIQDVVVVELANSPDWAAMDRGSISSKSLHSRFRRVVTCTSPSPELLLELQRVSSNKLIAKTNEVLARHGRPIRPVASTVFDDWILTGDRVRGSAITPIVDCCELVAFWSFSDWGLYARVVASTIENATGAVVRAGRLLGIPVKEVPTESGLPTW